MLHLCCKYSRRVPPDFRRDRRRRRLLWAQPEAHCAVRVPGLRAVSCVWFFERSQRVNCMSRGSDSMIDRCLLSRAATTAAEQRYRCHC
jgi:hypothetical protein